MKNEKFYNEIANLLLGRKINLSFLIDWFEETISLLKTLSKQDKYIKHIRHLGNSRENNFFNIIESIIPDSIGITKGYAIDKNMANSYEQDCILYNKKTSAKLIKTKNITYLPIESIFSSIEIKSTLSITELKKSILNCISLKRLQYDHGLHNLDKKRTYDDLFLKSNICYYVFAYNSDLDLNKIKLFLNKISELVPKSLGINMIYILGKGLILPTTYRNGGIGFCLENVTNLTGNYGSIYTEKFQLNKMFKNKESILFLWYLSIIIDQSLDEMKKINCPDYGDYVFSPMFVAKFVEEYFDIKKNKNNDA